MVYHTVQPKKAAKIPKADIDDIEFIDKNYLIPHSLLHSTHRSIHQSTLPNTHRSTTSTTSPCISPTTTIPSRSHHPFKLRLW